ncbi:MAG: ABC transporter permease subunit [Rhodococcus sp. (in: high G+C Gram-positive bacteria)]|uniref:ABC transporter permease n=1 Tax=Rhodococcus sp. TaxID=1831 RepID=UPI003BB67ECA
MTVTESESESRLGLGYLDGVLTVFGLEIRQRVRSRGWYVLLAVWFTLVCAVTALADIAFDEMDFAGQAMYELVLGFVLFFALLVVPALSANSVSGDRAAGTLAILQNTLLRPGQLLWGKWLAAWVVALGFLAVAVPALAWAVLRGDVHALSLPVLVLMVALELAVMCAVGVGISARSHRPLFAVTATYLITAFFAVGTLIGFGLSMQLVAEDVRIPRAYYEGPSEAFPNGRIVCSDTDTRLHTDYRTERIAWMLAANPFVVVADAAPRSAPDTDRGVLGGISEAVRTAQSGTISDNACSNGNPDGTPTRDTAPIWPLGVGIQFVVAAGLLTSGYRRTRTPIGRLPTGMRVA